MIEYYNLNSLKLFLSRLNPFSSVALLGVFIYIVLFALPLKFIYDIPLIIFSLFSFITIVSNIRTNLHSNISNSLLYILFFLFLFVVMLTILTSENILRSLEFSAPLIPAMLIFFVITQYSKEIKDIYLIYVALSLIAIILCLLLLKAFFLYRTEDPFFWVSVIKSPILVVKNDITLFAILAPISLSLFFYNSSTVIRIIAVFSIILSIFIIGTFQSRVSMLTMIISMVCFFMLFKPKVTLFYTIIIIILLLLIDGFNGFKLIIRFINNWDGSGRIPLWLSAWYMFLEAPFLGKGFHTFGVFYKEYMNKLVLPEWLFIDKRIVPWPHNLYFEALAEQGIIGLISLCLVLFYGLFIAYRLRLAKLEQTRILGCGVFSGFSGFCFAAFFELTFLRKWVVILLFLFLAIIVHLSNIQKGRR